MPAAFALRWRALLVLFWAVLGNSFSLMRYGIASAGVKRVTAAKALQAQRYSLRRSVSFNCFAHILRTRRIEAAGGWQERGNQSLVPAEGDDEASPDISVDAEARAHLIKR